MAFEYSCFISYPHGQENVLVPIVEDFVKGLRQELGAQDRRPVWFDQTLTGGRRLDPAVGMGLCKSACMIMLYTPLYFDEEHTYCARELKAMQDLEKERMKFLADKTSSLIIPVILRGEKRFPDAMKQTLYYDFTQIFFNSRSINVRQKYAKELRKIADYIKERLDSLDAVGGALKHDCDNHCLPTIEVARSFVKDVLGKSIVTVSDSFPGQNERVEASV